MISTQTIEPPLSRPRRRAALPLRTAWLVACCSIAGAVRAQTPSALSEWQYSAGVPLASLFAPKRPDWQIATGLAGSFEPLYDGASKYVARVGPNVDIRYRDLFFLSTGEGLGANVLRGPNWRVTLSVGYDLGRRAADDLDHLRGMGNINPAAVAKLSADYVVSKSFPLVLRADVRRSIGGTDGWIGDLSAYMPLPGSNSRFFWFAGPSVTFADSRYMNGWFGVSSAQAQRSGLARYSANAGIRSVNFGTTMVWFFRKHWFLTADAAVEQLVGRAANSPLTSRSTNAVVDLSVNYQF